MPRLRRAAKVLLRRPWARADLASHSATLSYPETLTAKMATGLFDSACPRARVRLARRCAAAHALRAREAVMLAPRTMFRLCARGALTLCAATARSVHVRPVRRFRRPGWRRQRLRRQPRRQRRRQRGRASPGPLRDAGMPRGRAPLRASILRVRSRRLNASSAAVRARQLASWHSAAREPWADARRAFATQNEFKLLLDCPGVDAEGLNIECEGNVLRVRCVSSRWQSPAVR